MGLVAPPKRMVWKSKGSWLQLDLWDIPLLRSQF